MPKQAIPEIARKHDINHKSKKDSLLQFWQDILSNHPKLNPNKIPIETLEDVAKLDSSTIANVIENSFDEFQREFNSGIWDMSVAPPDQFRGGYRQITEENLHFVSPQEKIDLCTRALAGQAQNGHSVFTNSYFNSGIENVLHALHTDPLIKNKKMFSRESFGTRSQETIDNIVYGIENTFKDIFANIDNLSSKDYIKDFELQNGVPIKINMIEFIRGFFFASLMDNYANIRTKGFRKYGHQTGGGEGVISNLNLVKEYGINQPNMTGINYNGHFKLLNLMSAEKRMEVLEKLKIVEDNSLDLANLNTRETNWNDLKTDSAITNMADNPHLRSQYIRSARGHGVGDDIAVYLASFLPQTFTEQGHVETPYDATSRMLGALMADKIDTIEKDAILHIPGGQDEVAGQYTNLLFRSAAQSKKFRNLFNIKYREDGQYDLVNESTIVDFTLASANLDTTIHSSQRWFYKDISNTSAISEYAKFMYFNQKALGNNVYSPDIKHGFKVDFNSPVPDADFTFKQVPMKDIQYIMRKRQELVERPEDREKNLLMFYLNNS